MAVELTTASPFVLGKTADALSDTERTSLPLLLDWANAAVETYLSGGTAPEAVTDLAVLRVVYYDWHTRYSRRPADGGMLDARFRRDAPLAPLRASGAMALLSPYKRRGVGTLAND